MERADIKMTEYAAKSVLGSTGCAKCVDGKTYVTAGIQIRLDDPQLEVRFLHDDRDVIEPMVVGRASYIHDFIEVKIPEVLIKISSDADDK